MNPFVRLLLESSIRVSLVAASVALILQLMRIRSSALRHAAWTAVLCAMLLMPVLPYFVPSVSVPVASPDVTPAAYPPELPPLPPPAMNSGQAEPPAAPIPDAPPARGPVWPIAVLVGYGIGVLALLSRLWLGWRSVQQVAQGSARIAGQQAPVYESALVATPLTVGVVSPKIILPVTWSQWPEEKLRAVLAHELAHVERRDLLVSLLAHLNRCVFWFHPLAWWLERKLALTAEQACDDAGVRAAGESRKYAEILLDMAETVRRSGSRLSWQGVGVDGTGLLGQRIDRILRGNFFGSVSRTRKVIIALSCAAIIFFVAACHQKAKFEALKEDPQVTAEMARQKAASESNKAVLGMNVQQVAELEALVKKNPEDLEARRKLLMFYAESGVKVLGEKRAAEARKFHSLWLIQHHPENELVTAWGTHIGPSDQPAYAQARRLWLAHTERQDVPVAVLTHAAFFFTSSDSPLAEKLLLRAQAADPKGHYSAWLCRLYAQVISGPDAQGAYAQEIRKKLAESTDAELLIRTGNALTMVYGMRPPKQKATFDPMSLGKSYLERGLQLNPNSASARSYLGMLRAIDHIPAAIRNVPPESGYQAVSSLPEAERLQFLPGVARNEYMQGDMQEYYKHDLVAAKASWERARSYAREALQLASKFRNDPNYGTAIYRANMTLGMVAMRVDGDKNTATKHLLEASKAPATEELAHSADYFTFKLPVLLLKYGGADEREAVIEYLERFGKISQRPDSPLLKSAAQLRKGYMPSWYQYQAAKLK
jgi:hypothetical protein